MSMTLTDINGNIYTLNDTFKITDMSWKKKNRVIPIAFRDGGDEIGDKKIDTRTITIEGIVSDNTTYAATMALLNSWFNKTDLKLSVIAGKYINVKVISGVDNDFYEGGFNRVSHVKFTCVCPDPFFYSTTLISNVYAVAASPYSFIITNASYFDIYPAIGIINGANNHSLIIQNVTDDGNYFGFDDVTFDNTETLAINNWDGFVVENGLNAIQYMSGNFLRLLPGANNFTYTGAICNLTFEYYDLEL